MRRGWFVAGCLLGGFVGCHCPPSDADPGAVADAAAPATTTAAAPDTTGVAPAETAPTLEGSTVKLTLRSGAEITLPAIAEAHEAPGRDRMPAEVLGTHLYHLGSSKRLLLVNEFDLAGKDCSTVIDEEIARMNQAKADTDPARRQFRQVGKVETISVGGERVLYADSMNRGVGGLDAGRPAVAMATMVACRGGDHLVLMYTLDQPELPSGIKQMLSDVVASYSAKR